MRTHISYLIIALLTVTATTEAADIVGTLPGEISVDNKGAANYAIPIEVIPGRLGMQPDLAISYNSGAGNGLLGVGFNLSGLSSISRGRTILARDGKVDGIDFDTTDKLYLDGKRLILITGTGTYFQPGSQYRTEVESFSRITALRIDEGTTGDVDYFKVEEKEGRILYYGKKDAANDGDALHTVINSGGADPVLSWGLKRVEDRNGNYIEYEYDGDPGGIGQHLLSYIEYTKKSGGVSPFAKVSFTYEDRDDDSIRYVGGHSEQLIKRLDKIEVIYTASNPDVIIRRYSFGYETSYASISEVSRLLSIKLEARKDSNSSNPLEDLTPTTFAWSNYSLPDPDPDTAANTFDGSTPSSLSDGYPYPFDEYKRDHFFADFNGDGKDDLFDGTTVYLSTGTGFSSGTNWLNGNTSLSLFSTGDFNGDGLADVLMAAGSLNQIEVALSDGTQFVSGTGVAKDSTQFFDDATLWEDYDTSGTTYNVRNAAGIGIKSRMSVADFNGDGRDDVLLHNFLGELWVYYANGESTVFDTPTSAARTGLNTIGVDIVGVTPEDWRPKIYNYFTVIGLVGDYNGDGRQDYGWVEHLPRTSSSGGTIHLKETYKAYICVSKEDGTFEAPSTFLQDEDVATKYLDYTWYRFLTGDYNGDGITDILAMNSGTIWDLYLFMGHSSAPSRVQYSNAFNLSETPEFDPYFQSTTQEFWDDDIGYNPSLWIDPDHDEYENGHAAYVAQTNPQASHMYAKDFNMDGMTDFAWIKGPIQGTTQTDSGWYVSYSNGTGFEPPVDLMDYDAGGLDSGAFYDYANQVDEETFESNLLNEINVQFPDINGDGLPDWVFETRQDGDRLFSFASGDRGDLVTKITNGLGSVTEIRYDPITNDAIYTKGIYGSGIDYPIRAVQDSRHVVSDVFKDSGLAFTVSTTSGVHSVGTGNAHHFTYQYSGGVTDLSGRGFLGYRSFVTWDTETDLLSYQFLTQSFPMTGLVQREQTYRYFETGSSPTQHNFRIITSIDNDTYFNAVRKEDDSGVTGSYFPYIARTETLKFEDSSSPHYFSDDDTLSNSGSSIDIGDSDQLSHSERLFDKDASSFTGNGFKYHSQAVSYVWYDEQNIATTIDTTLPTGFDTDDDDVIGFIKSDWDNLTIPSDIRFGNVIQTQNYYGYDALETPQAGDGFSDATITTYLTDSTNRAAWLIDLASTTYTSGSSADVSGTYFTPLYTYTYDTKGRIKTRKTDSGSTNTERDSQVEYFYDSTYGLMDYQTVKGFMTTTTDPHYIGTTAYTTVDNTFGGSGDATYRWPTTVENAHGHDTVYEYNELTGKPESVTDVNGYEIETTYDALGRALTVKDVPLNITTTTTITETTGGSIITVNAPSGIADSVNLSSKYKIETTAPKQPKVTQYLDRLGRGIRTIKEAYASQSAKTDTAYDNQGRIIGVSNPYSGSSPSWWTTTTYDALGRIDEVTSANDTVTTNYYNGRLTLVEVDVTDAKDENDGALPEDVAVQRTVTLVNSRGDTHKIWNADVAPSVSTFNNWYTNGSNATTPSIEFNIDGFGRVCETILKDQEAYIVMEYDDLGNQITLKDPDKGVYSSGNTNYSADWEYSYNGLGQMVTQEDANGNDTVMEYDTLGRPLEKTITETLHSATDTTTWYYYDAQSSGNPNTVYDDANGWIGSLQRVENAFDSTVNQADYSNSVAHYYDDKGRVKMSLHHIDNKWYYEYTRYDTTASTNRIKKLDYFWRPTGYENDYNTHPSNWLNYGLSYVYDSNFSYVIDIIDSQGREWWDADATTGYDFLDRPQKFQKGSGHWTHKDFDLRTGLLNSIVTGTSGGSAYIQNLSFEWDGWANLQKRINGKISTTETFDYDNLNRLTDSDVGLDSYTIAYAANGNITSKKPLGAGSANSYTYASSKPHAVTSAAGFAIEYDNNGNMKSREDSTYVWTYWWSGFDKPRWLFEQDDGTFDVSGSEFRYGVDHQRNVHLKFDTSDTSTDGGKPLHYTHKKVYVGSLMEIDYENAITSGSSTDWEQKKIRVYVNGPTGKLGTFTFETDAGETDQEAIVYHYDHLGSIESITEYGNSADNTWAKDDSDKDSRYSYDPWGERRDPLDWKGVASGEGDGGEDDLTPRGFTGHEMLDDIGLVHMNGRIYDPLLGRFLSADILVQFPSDLQSYNRYSYIRNNPLSGIDPSGFNEEDEELKRLEEERLERARKFLEVWSKAYEIFGEAGVKELRAQINERRMESTPAEDAVVDSSPSSEGNTDGQVARSNQDSSSLKFATVYVSEEARNTAAVRDARMMRNLEAFAETFTNMAPLAGAGLAPRVPGTRLSINVAPTRTPTPEATGQLHHMISRPVHRALEQHPVLRGQYSARDNRFVTRARDLDAHKGYQTWHRELDAEIPAWLQRNPSATTSEWESYMINRYAKPDLNWRFPLGLEK